MFITLVFPRALGWSSLLIRTSTCLIILPRPGLFRLVLALFNGLRCVLNFHVFPCTLFHRFSVRNFSGVAQISIRLTHPEKDPHTHRKRPTHTGKKTHTHRKRSTHTEKDPHTGKKTHTQGKRFSNKRNVYLCVYSVRGANWNVYSSTRARAFGGVLSVYVSQSVAAFSREEILFFYRMKSFFFYGMKYGSYWLLFSTWTTFFKFYSNRRFLPKVLHVWLDFRAAKNLRRYSWIEWRTLVAFMTGIIFLHIISLFWQDLYLKNFKAKVPC